MTPAEAVGAAPGLLGLPAGRGDDLGAAIDSCVDRLLAGGPDAPALADLLCGLHEAALRRTRDRVNDRARRIAGCEQGLGRLRSVTTTAALVQRVCDEVAASCGFERVLLSRVEDGLWRPWRVNTGEETERWYVDWADRPTQLARMYLETAIAEQHRPALLHDTAHRSVHPIIRAGHSTSFVVAPISPEGRVTGFLHADHGRGGPACDEVDRDLLWAFAEGFANLFERAALLERLREQRGRVRDALAVADATLARLTESEIELVLAPDDSSVTRAASAVTSHRDGIAQLTPRERDILAVVAEGATNSEIAERFVLSVGTVKTHVKHILAKLGAVNRSQAIAAYLAAKD